jgi:hypothetical protein
MGKKFVTITEQKHFPSDITLCFSLINGKKRRDKRHSAFAWVSVITIGPWEPFGIPDICSSDYD